MEYFMFSFCSVERRRRGLRVRRGWRKGSVGRVVVGVRLRLGGRVVKRR